MKMILLVLLIKSASAIFAAEKFGGFSFDNSVNPYEIEIFKNDLTYMYQKKFHQTDYHLKKLTYLHTITGPYLHNWLINRARHIVGIDYAIDGDQWSNENWRGLFFRYPQTPLPQNPNRTDDNQVQKVGNNLSALMSNIGIIYYITGKEINNLFSTRIGKNRVFITSPRVGILKIGPKLFDKDYLINHKRIAAESNSILRLEVLFHEARHSDGTGESTGFYHKKCPPNHKYENLAICDSSLNGAYSIGAFVIRHFLKNCESCTHEEKLQLEIITLEDFNRTPILSEHHSRDNLKIQLKEYEGIIQNYKQLAARKNDNNNDYLAEIDRLRQKIKKIERRYFDSYEGQDSDNEYPFRKGIVTYLNPTFEGKFREITIKESSSMMERSLQPSL